jgi:hypothetical protein
MIKAVGSRIVPGFVLYKKGFLGRRKVVATYIGFEVNLEEIKMLIGIK